MTASSGKWRYYPVDCTWASLSVIRKGVQNEPPREIGALLIQPKTSLQCLSQIIARPIDSSWMLKESGNTTIIYREQSHHFPLPERWSRIVIFFSFEAPNQLPTHWLWLLLHACCLTLCLSLFPYPQPLLPCQFSIFPKTTVHSWWLTDWSE